MRAAEPAADAFHTPQTATADETPAGKVVARSDLDDRRSVECRGVAQGAWPVLAYQIRASMPGGAAGDSRVTVSIDRPLAGGSVPERVFDLEAVRASVKPEVVNDQRGDG